MHINDPALNTEFLSRFPPASVIGWMMAVWKVGWQMGANMSCFRLRISNWRLKPRVSKGGLEIWKSQWHSDSHQDLILKKKEKSLSILMCIFLGLRYHCGIIAVKSGRCFPWQYCEGCLAFSWPLRAICSQSRWAVRIDQRVLRTLCAREGPIQLLFIFLQHLDLFFKYCKSEETPNPVCQTLFFSNWENDLTVKGNCKRWFWFIHSYIKAPMLEMSMPGSANINTQVDMYTRSHALTHRCVFPFGPKIYSVLDIGKMCFVPFNKYIHFQTYWINTTTIANDCP